MKLHAPLKYENQVRKDFGVQNTPDWVFATRLQSSLDSYNFFFALQSIFMINFVAIFFDNVFMFRLNYLLNTFL